MDFEIKQFISQSEFNRSEKQQLTKVQNWVSIIILILALGNAIMLFTITGYVVNYITLGYGIVNALVVILCIATLLWSYQQQRYLSNTEDEWGELTDNFNGRIIFFFSIFFAILQFVSIILCILSQGYITGLYESSNNSNDIKKFQAIVDFMKPIIVIFGIIIVIGLTYTIHNFYQMTISSITSRFNIYLLCISISLTCWGSVYQLRGLQLDNVDIIINLIILVMVLLAVISNTWKIKGLLMILAALQALLIPVMLGLQAEYIRDYQEQQQSNLENCPQLMNSLTESYLKDHQCSNKYIMETSTTNCPNSEKECQIYSSDCKKEQQIQRWETTSTDPSDVPLGCLNLSCCNTTSSLFTRDLVILIILTLSTPLFLFALILFEFHLSRKQKTDRTLGRNIETLFLLLFIGTIVFGILLNTNKFSSVPQKENVSFAEKALKAKQFSRIQSTICQGITDLVGTRIELSNECQDTKLCPLYQATTSKKDTNILFGLWVKGVSQIKKGESTNYQTQAAAKFLWPTYNGNGQDFFIILGKLDYVQNYFDNAKICYSIGNKELDINLYQNIVDIPINDNSTQTVTKHFNIYDHFAATASTTSTSASPTSTSSTSTPSSGTQSSGTQSTSAGTQASNSNQCTIPNCDECQQGKCTKCKAKFDADDSRGCKFTGKLGVTQNIIVQLFKELKSKVTGYIVGEIMKDGDSFYTQYPLSNANICWNSESLEKPICQVTTAKGDYSLQISTFDVADYSTQQFQPTVGQITVSVQGYEDYVQTQVVEFEEQNNFGTVLIRSNVTIPILQTTTTKSTLTEFATTATTTTGSTSTTGSTGTTGSTSSTGTISSGASTTSASSGSTSTTGTTGTGTVATTCKTGEYQDAKGKCQPTLCTNVTNCRFCDSANKCLSCIDEYSVQSGSCLPNNGCSKPQSQNNCFKCTTDKEKCDSGYCDALSTYDTGICKKSYNPCTTKIANCAFCTIANKCAVCEQGYKIDNGECKLGSFDQIFKTSYYQTTITVIDSMDQSTIKNSKVDLRVGSCGSSQTYGYNRTDENGQALFSKLISGVLYNIIVTNENYSQNCYEFIDQNTLFVPLSKQLNQGQVRIVLEWPNNNIDLDLQLSYNLNDKNCLIGYLNHKCSGAYYGTPSKKHYNFEAIQIDTLLVTNYLIFVTSYGSKQDYQKTLITSNARIKYYVADMDEPAVTFFVPNDKQQSFVGTNEAEQTQWLAWLVGCINASDSEIPEAIISSNGVWWTSSLNKWYSEIPAKTSQNFPSPTICKVV